MFENVTLQYKRSLLCSIGDAFTFSMMMAFGESFIVPLALYLGFSGGEIGIITGLPILCGAILQTFSGWFLALFKTRKRMMLFMVFVQASSLLLYIAILYFKFKSVVVFTLVSIIYWGINLALNPIWASWLNDLTVNVPKGRYFARRVQISNFALFITMIPAGFFLKFMTNIGHTVAGFAVLFALAALSRYASWVFILMKHEPKMQQGTGINPVQFIKGTSDVFMTSKANVLFFLIFFNFGVFIAAPFFTPFMLDKLNFGYEQFIIIQSLGIIGKVIFLPAWGFIMEHYGTRKPLIMCSVLATLLPLLWIFSGNFWYLCFINIFTGIIWGGFELSSLSMLMNNYDSKQTVLAWSWFNTLNGFGQVTSSSISGRLQTIGVMNYHEMFFASAVVRILAVILLAKKIKEYKTFPSIRYHHLFMRVFSVRSSIAPAVFPEKSSDK